MTLIRSATAADVPAVLPMVQAVCDFHRALEPARYDFVPDIAARYASWLPKRAQDPASVFLVGEVDGLVSGFLVGEVLDEIPIYTVKKYGFIHDLWVEPRARRAGLGRALVAEAVKRFDAMGVTQVRGDTAWGNEGARRLVAALGFAPSTVQVIRAV
jgi:GNAT superfamily N-acetyltransferase